jgi:hypothetical protein
MRSTLGTLPLPTSPGAPNRHSGPGCAPAAQAFGIRRCTLPGCHQGMLRQAEREASGLGAKNVMQQSSLTALRFCRGPGIAALDRRSKDSASPPATR